MLTAKKVNCYIYCFVKDPSIRWKFDVQNGNGAMQKQQQQQQQQLHYNDLQVKVFFGTILTSFQILFQIIEIRSVAILLEERKNIEAATKNWDFDAFGDLQ